MSQAVPPRQITAHESQDATGGAPDGGHSGERGYSALTATLAMTRSAALPPRSLWPRIPGSAVAVLAGVFLFDADTSRTIGLTVLYAMLPLAVIAIEVAGAFRARAAALESALGAWILVLTLLAAAFIRFGITHGIAALAIVIVLADIASFTLAIWRTHSSL